MHFANDDDTQRVSLPAVRIAIIGIAIALAVMMISVAIVVGFKQEIRNKIASFSGHLQVLAIADNRTFEKQPICCTDSLLDAISNLTDVSSATPFITKPAVIKTADDFLCVVAKSMDTDSADDDEDSETHQGGQGLCISQTIASKLNLTIGDRIKLYFSSDDGIKVRTLTVSDTYQTHYNEYDSQVVMVSAKLLRQICGWDEDMASGIEIRLADFKLLDSGYESLTDAVGLTQDRRGTQLMVQRIDQQNPQMFAWLDLLDTNVWVILGLMLAVSSFTMISGLLIIILERKRTIGLLKALGCSNTQLRHTFLYMASFLTLRGLFWGNVIGLGLCLVQWQWHPLHLDPTNYYLEYVPISLNVWHILLLNAGTLFLTMAVLLIPSQMVARISPREVMEEE